MSQDRSKLSREQWDAMDAQAQLSFIRDEVRKIATDKGAEGAINDTQVQNLIQHAKVDTDAAVRAAKEGAAAGEKSKSTIAQNKEAIANAASSGTKTSLQGSAEEQGKAKEQVATDVAAKSGGGQSAIDKAKAQIEALTNNVPDWVLSLTGGSTPNSEQKKKIVQAYNLFFKGEQIPDNVSDVDLWTKLGTVQNGDFVKAVNNSINSLHEEGKRYTFPTGDSFFLSGDRYQNAIKGYDANEQTIDMAVNMAHALGLSTGGAGPQDTMWQPILALATALGKTGPNVAQDIRAEQQKPPSEQAHTYSGSAADRPSPAGGPGTAADQATAGFVYNDQLPGGMSVYDAAKKFQANLATYNGDRGLALLATFDKGLADRFLANGRKFLDPNDVQKAAQVFLDSKWGNIADVGLATEKDANVVAALLQGDVSGAYGGAAGAASGRVVQLPDPEKVKQAANEMWQGLFLSDAPIGWADQQVQAINDKILGRQQRDTNKATNDVTTDTDPTAQLLEALRASPLYQILYGKKQPGQSEQDFLNQFTAAGSSMLGNQAPDVSAIQAGMQSGEYQTTVGAIAGSSRSLDNSTFMERLARAAQAVNQYT